MRRRLYVVAIAALSAYCLTDALAHGKGETARHDGIRVFTAEIVDAPILPASHIEAAEDAPAPRVATAEDAPAANPQPAAPDSPEPASAEDVTPPAPEAPVIVAAPAPVEPASKPHPAHVLRRAATRHTSKPERLARAPEPESAAPMPELAGPMPAAPTWRAPVERFAAAPHRVASGGCSGARWSQPDAAGAPVLLCE